MITLHAIIEVKPYSLTELAVLYGVSNRTIKNWIKPFQNLIGKKVGRYYTIPQVKIILFNLGLPGRYIDDDNKQNS